MSVVAVQTGKIQIFDDVTRIEETGPRRVELDFDEVVADTIIRLHRGSVVEEIPPREGASVLPEETVDHGKARNNQTSDVLSTAMGHIDAADMALQELSEIEFDEDSDDISETVSPDEVLEKFDECEMDDDELGADNAKDQDDSDE